MDWHIKDLSFYKTTKQINLLADKAYESKNLRIKLNKYNYRLIIPKKKKSKIIYFFDSSLNKKRIFIENTFQKNKTFRRVFIRYYRLFRNYSSFVFLALPILIHRQIYKE